MTGTRWKLSAIDQQVLKRVAKAPCYVQSLQAAKKRVLPLVTAGLIERCASETNPGMTMVRITARGADALERLA